MFVVVGVVGAVLLVASFLFQLEGRATMISTDGASQDPEMAATDVPQGRHENGELDARMVAA